MKSERRYIQNICVLLLGSSLSTGLYGLPGVKRPTAKATTKNEVTAQGALQKLTDKRGTKKHEQKIKKKCFHLSSRELSMILAQQISCYLQHHFLQYLDN